MASRVSIYRQQLKRRLDAGETILCGICGYPVVARAKGDNRLIQGGLGAVTIDHIIPKALGGSSRRDNLQPAHLKCNNDKGATAPVI